MFKEMTVFNQAILTEGQLIKITKFLPENRHYSCIKFINKVYPTKLMVVDHNGHIEDIFVGDVSKTLSREDGLKIKIELIDID